MTIIGVVTNNGLSQSITAQSNNGWYIALSKFKVSNISVGSRLTLATSRTRSSINEATVFHTAPISSKVVQSSQLLQVNCTVPPEVNGNVATDITEIYVFGESPQYDVASSAFNNPSANRITVPSAFGSMLVNSNTVIFKENAGSSFTGSGLAYDTTGTPAVYYVKKINSTTIELYSDEALTTIVPITNGGSGTHKICLEYLFAIGQPNLTIQYDPTGAVILRLLFNLMNVDVNSIFQFPYTQATEIYDHNNDPNAHPLLQTALNEGGLYVVGGSATFVYKGQNFIRKSLSDFHSSVVDKKPVYWDTTTSLFKLAQATNDDKSKFVGFYFASDNSIRTGGTVQIGHVFSINTPIYLSDSVAGGLTSTPTRVKLGMSIGSGNILMTGVLSGTEITTLTELSDVTITSPVNNQVLRYNDLTNEWENSNLNIIQGNTTINLQQIEYQNALVTNNYNYVSYDTFTTNNLFTSDGITPSPTYDGVESTYDTINGTILQTGNLLLNDSGVPYTQFRVHAVSDNGLFTTQYSLNGTSWSSISLDTDYTIAPFSTFYLKFTFTGVDVFQSYGFFFDQNLGSPPVTFYLDDLNDVTITSPVDSQILSYDGTKWINSDLSEQLLYNFLIFSLPYTYVNFNLCNVSGYGFGTSSGLVFDINTNSYGITNTDTFTTVNLVTVVGTYYDFQFHIETTATYTLEYKLSTGGSLVAFTADTNVNIGGGFTELYIKVTFTGSGTLHSYGALYERVAATSNIQLNDIDDVTITSVLDSAYLIYSQEEGQWVNLDLFPMHQNVLRQSENLSISPWTTAGNATIVHDASAGYPLGAGNSTYVALEIYTGGSAGTLIQTMDTTLVVGDKYMLQGWIFIQTGGSAPRFSLGGSTEVLLNAGNYMRTSEFSEPPFNWSTMTTGVWRYFSIPLVAGNSNNDLRIRYTGTDAFRFWGLHLHSTYIRFRYLATTTKSKPALTVGDLFELDRLSDVSSETATNGQVLTYVSANNRWEPTTVSGVGEVNTGSNLGAGTGQVFKQKTGVDFEHRTLKQGTNITITQDASEITINSTGGSGEVNTSSNVGTGAGLLAKAKVGVDLPFKSIKAGTNITITNNTDDVTIDSTAGDITGASNVGLTGENVFRDEVTGVLNFRKIGTSGSLTAGIISDTISIAANIASSGEINTGSDNLKLITSAGLSASKYNGGSYTSLIPYDSVGATLYTANPNTMYRWAAANSGINFQLAPAVDWKVGDRLWVKSSGINGGSNSFVLTGGGSFNIMTYTSSSSTESAGLTTYTIPVNGGVTEMIYVGTTLDVIFSNNGFPTWIIRMGF